MEWQIISYHTSVVTLMVPSSDFVAETTGADGAPHVMRRVLPERTIRLAAV